MLAGVKAVLDDFDKECIVYCHFKSNQHVAPAVCGKTDLDILIQKEYYSKATSLLVGRGYKRFNSQLVTSYPAVEDWIGFDTDTGALSHIHLHWQLTAGEPRLKGYRIPWEANILESRVYDDENNIFISSHEHELVLLLVRMSLKYRFRNRLNYILTKRHFVDNPDFVNEFVWLNERVDSEKLIAITTELLSSKAANLVKGMISRDSIDPELFGQFRRQVRVLLKPNRTYHPISAILTRWFRGLYAYLLVLLTKHCGVMLARRRTPSTGGIVVAILGPDGSGKSTQVSQVRKWLGWKIDVGYVYFGSGDGPKSWLRSLFTRARDIFSRSNRSISKQTKVGNQTGTKQTVAKQLYRLIWALLLLREKRKNFVRATRARNKGVIVVCDRYPQHQYPDFSDGPLLSDWLGRSGLWRFAADYEKKVFENFGRQPPDIVIKLSVSHETAAKRKPDTPSDRLAVKIDTLQKLEFPSRCYVYQVDAEKPLSDVTLDVRKLIWQHI